MLPELKLTQEERSEIDDILKEYPDANNKSFPIASGDEIEIDNNGKKIYPWCKFEDHRDDTTQIEIYEREHEACIDHIL